MRVYFVEGRGFGGASGFVEVPDGKSLEDKLPVYEKQQFLDVDIVCQDVEITLACDLSIGRIREEDAIPEPSQPKRRITAKGIIGKARWQRYSLSFLGSERKHDTISVSIHESEEEACFVAGMKGLNDIDLDIDEGFFVQMMVSTTTFDSLLSAISGEDTELSLRVGFHNFNGFFAVWSPSISEGRVIKYIDSYKRVENKEDIPEGFLAPTFDRFRKPEKPVQVSITRRLYSSKKKSLDDEEE